MTCMKFVLFALFAVVLSLLSLSDGHAGLVRGAHVPDLLLQKSCPDGQEWSEEDNRCVPEEPRGSF